MKDEIEVVNGDGSELDISEVSSHITSLKPKTKSEKSKKEIVIPEKKEIDLKEKK